MTEWSNTVTCPSPNNGCVLFFSSSFYSSNDYVYAAPCYDSTVFLFKFNQTSGDTLGTQYISDLS